MLIELHYLPCIYYMQQVQHAETIVFEAHENYQKSSYRNRCHILGSDGPMRLSIPLLQGKNQRQTIREVRIENAISWQRQHLHALRSAYGSSPFWEHYVDYFEAHFQKKQTFLWDWNMETFLLLKKLLKLKTPIELTAAYEPIDSESVAAIDMRNKITPKHHFETDAYPQVFSYKHEFAPNLSVIDLLLNTGRI